MIEISQAVEYGVRGLMQLVQRQSGRPVHVKEIAEAEEISMAFLYKIFRRMARGRILNSRRGVGYSLALPPEEITILDIIQAIEGPIVLKPCIVDESYCDRTNQCVLAAFWASIQEEIVERLRGVSIVDLATGPAAGEGGSFPGRPLPEGRPPGRKQPEV